VFDSLTDSFIWIPLNTFEQKYTFSSAIRHPNEEIRGPKKGRLEIVNFEEKNRLDPYAVHPGMIGAP
jgi:hypothetical protein